jgi:putative ABC transport system ATP-binding protein
MANDPLPLVLSDVEKVYGEGAGAVRAVNSASLEVRPGETVAIVGPSGSGKTTLLSIAGCLLRPTSGRVIILGEDVTRVGQPSLAGVRRRHIGFVFQSFNLLSPLTARENVEIALNLSGLYGREARERSGKLLNMLDLQQFGDRKPSDLSGGEQQRLAVARALANRPDIILADEPTASLDSRAGHRVMELMRSAVEAGEAKALVIVTHDSRILDVVDRVLLMEDGSLRQRGHDSEAAYVRLKTQD